VAKSALNRPIGYLHQSVFELNYHTTHLSTPIFSQKGLNALFSDQLICQNSLYTLFINRLFKSIISSIGSPGGDPVLAGPGRDLSLAGLENSGAGRGWRRQVRGLVAGQGRDPGLQVWPGGHSGGLRPGGDGAKYRV
jgi:hypothetical protein